jgi:hypothetical protein
MENKDGKRTSQENITRNQGIHIRAFNCFFIDCLYFVPVKNFSFSCQARWHMPIVPAIQEVEVGELIETRSSIPAWDNIARTHLKKSFFSFPIWSVKNKNIKQTGFKTGFHHVAQAGLKLVILLPPKYWDYRNVPPTSALKAGFKALHKTSCSWVLFP